MAKSTTNAGKQFQGLLNQKYCFGGFYTEINFLGAIGNILQGSRLSEVLECVYASNTVSHMLCGKALSWAVRGHILVSAAVHALLMATHLC